MKKTKKKKTKKSYHLVFYVENCTSKVRRFESKEKVSAFIAKFLKEWPTEGAMNHGSWVDYAVFDIKGDIVFITDEYDVIDG